MENEKVIETKTEKKIEDEKDDIMLQDLCAKMIKNGKLKYTKDRKGNLGKSSPVKKSLNRIQF